MATNPYDPCPCGSGKKIKFCCHDIIAHVEKLQRMQQGEQRRAALDYIRHTVPARHREHAAILGIRVDLELGLEETGAAEVTAKTFVERYPDNPIAQAYAAVSACQGDDPAVAMSHLARALALSSNELDIRVFQAIMPVAQFTLLAGRYWAGRSLLLLASQLIGDRESPERDFLFELNRSRRVSIWHKDDPSPPECSRDEPYKAAFDAAMDTYYDLNWLSAVEQLEAITRDHPQAAPAWSALAAIRCFLIDDQGACEAWRQFASLDTPHDDAVEALARAQTLSDDDEDDSAYIDEIRVTYAIDDVDRANQALLADRRIAAVPIDPRTVVEEGVPPPKGVFQVLDREMPSSADDLEDDQPPEVLADAIYFGRETDRAARLEVVVYRTLLEAVEETLRSALGDDLGESNEPEVVDRVAPWRMATTQRRRYPDDTPMERQIELNRATHRRMLLEVWPDQPLSALGGKTPREAANDESLAREALAAILVLEFTSNPLDHAIHSELREMLGLPPTGLISAMEIDVERIPLVRLHRVDLELLGSEPLLSLFQVAVMTFSPSVERFGDELIRRQDLPEELTPAKIYTQMALCASPADRAIEYLQKAQQSQIDRGESPAMWYLDELPLRMVRNETDEVLRLLELLRNHLREPEVAPRLQEILDQIGYKSGARDAAPSPDAAVNAPPAAAEPLWTPDGAPAAGAGKKSTLWTPGMD